VALWYPPPPPFTGGRQPHAPRQLAPAITAVQVDNPPFTDGGPVAIPSEISAIAQPDPWTYRFIGGRAPFEPRKMSPAIPGQSADPPPFVHRARTVWFAELVRIWQPDPWTFSYFGGRAPFDPKKLSPGIPGQSLDEPPHMLGGPYVLKLEAVAIAQPAPWSYVSWPYAFTGNRQPYMGRQLPAALEAVAVSPFPFTHRARTAQLAAIRAAWNPPPPDWQMVLYASHLRPQRIAPSARGYIIL
jgi:hypothetical protein